MPNLLFGKEYNLFFAAITFLPVAVTTSQYSLPNAPNLNPPGSDKLFASWTGLPSFHTYSTSDLAHPSKIYTSFILAPHNQSVPTYSLLYLDYKFVHPEEKEPDTLNRSMWGKFWCCREHLRQGRLWCTSWGWGCCERNQFSHFWRMYLASTLCWHLWVSNILFSLKETFL